MGPNNTEASSTPMFYMNKKNKNLHPSDSACAERKHVSHSQTKSHRKLAHEFLKTLLPFYGFPTTVSNILLPAVQPVEVLGVYFHYF